MSLSAVLVSLLASPLQAQAQERLSDGVMAQIRALQLEKASRSAIHRKLDSQFVFELKRWRGLAIAPGVASVRPDILRDADDRVLVDIKSVVTPPLLEQITRDGGTIVHSSPRFQSIRARVRLEQLENLAGAAGVTFIRPASQAFTHAGAVNSEGDATHGTDRARSQFGVTGRGLKVGVLSDGVGNLEFSQANGELGPVSILPGQAGPSGSEGTAMLEIIHDLAPDAELFFATAFNGEASFAENILNLHSNGCHIIVDDVGYFAEPAFQDGIIAQAVNAVTAQGTLYFSSAGNEGSIRYGTSGTWEGSFVDSGQSLPGYGGKIHRFGLTNHNAVLASGGGVDLYWADPAGASANDYDLFLVDSTGTNILHAANNAQTGSQDPYERIDTVPFQNSRIVVVLSSGDPRFLRVRTLRGRLSAATAGATHGHSAATNAISMAAVNAQHSFPESFTAASTVETFSSDGPRRIFFHADGSPITPGNYTATGGQVRAKPDLAAADGVMTSVYGFQPFYGTSAAAPHAAGIAALLWSFDPSLRAEEIRAAMFSTALDIEAPGHDANSGAGIVMVEAALGALAARAIIVAGSVTLVEESCPNNALDPGETVTVALSITNRGFAATTNLIGTLLNTNGVSLAGASQNFGAVASKGGTAVRTFSFGVAASCGDSTTVTLQLHEGAASLGMVRFPIRVGAPVLRLTEKFDHVIPSALPAGWTSATSGGGLPWRTTNSWSVSVYNSAYVSETGGVARVKVLNSPVVTVTSSNAQISFWQWRRMIENFGGVLEISTNGTAYRDILSMGGTVISGDYNGAVWTGNNNALEGRPVWTGSHPPTFTQIALPASTAGQNVQFRFRFAGGSSWVEQSSWFLDSIALSDGVACCSPAANQLLVDATSLPDSVILGDNFTYRVRVQNPGPDEATGISMTNTLPANFALHSITNPPDVTVSSVASNVMVFSIPSLAGGDSRTIAISGTPTASGLLTNRVTVARADGGLISGSNVIARTSVFLPLARIDDVTIVEGDAGTTEAIFRVSLTPAPATNASVRFATANQTAISGKDYFSTNGVLTFAPGVTNQRIAVRIIGNLLNEPTRTFALNLSTPTNLIVAKAQAIGTIVSEDPLPYLSVNDVTVVKPAAGTATALFRVGLSAPSGQGVAVNCWTQPGSALEDVDYRRVVTTLTFVPGQTNLSVAVFVTNHITLKPSQTFSLVLHSPLNAKLSRSEGVGTILTAPPGRLDHYTWELPPGSRSNGLPFSVTVTGRDYFGALATNSPPIAVVSAFAIESHRTNTFYRNTDAIGWWAGRGTRGYSFTPKTNLLVTHLRTFAHSISTLSLWKEDGTLLARESLMSTNGAWVEKKLATPLSLVPGQTYRLGGYFPEELAGQISAPVIEAPDVTFGQGYLTGVDAFPTTVDPYYRPAVDIRYTVGLPTPLPVTPTNSGSFSNSAWTGSVTVQLPATNVTLVARGTGGAYGLSEPFAVTPAPGQITHFAWEPMAALQPVSNAFPVKVSALDFFDQPILDYAGTADLSAFFITPGSRTNTMLGNLTHEWLYPDPNMTLGYSFTPKTNLTVTHFRSYFGNKVSLWTDSGILLTNRNVVGPAAAWTETTLTPPVQLLAGQIYRLGVYATTQHYYRNSIATNLADAVILEGFYWSGDGFPDYRITSTWNLVDLRYTVGFQTKTSVAINPTNASSFTNGVWAGGMIVNRLATNLTLQADDRIGHLGLSQPFNVGFVPGLLERFVWRKVPSPQTNSTAFAVTVTAVDHFNNAVTNFNGAVTLSAQSGSSALNVTPDTSGNFERGVWNGVLQVHPTASGVVLRAEESQNLFGFSEPFDLVEAPPSAPRMLPPALNADGIELAWTTVPGRTYQVHYCTNLSESGWIEIDPMLVATGTNLVWKAPFENDRQRFYRIQVVP